MESKKSGKGLIVLVVVLSILLVGTVGHICYNKYFLNDTNSNKKQELNEDKMKLALKLHEALTDGYDAYGLYFGKKQTIETVPANDILPYVVYSYFKDKKLELRHNHSKYFDFNYLDYKNKNDIVVVWNEEKETWSPVTNPLTVTKKELDNYFKEKFNTNRILEIKGGGDYCDEKCAIKTVIPESVCASYLYDIESKNLYFAGCETNNIYGGKAAPRYSIKTTNKFIKYETDDNNMYIYDKIVVRENYEIKYTYRKNHVTFDELISEYRNRYTDKWVATSDVIKDLNVKEEELNEEYILENYDEYLDTYKHTFKKADNGKYYWYSSEIVK